MATICEVIKGIEGITIMEEAVMEINLIVEDME